jgi:hypothetical protein
VVGRGRDGIILGTAFAIMHSVLQEVEQPPLVSAVCVGQALSPALLAACHREHVAVVISTRGMQLLRHFRPDAVICLDADPQAVTALAGSKVPVVVLAADPWEWTIPGVTVISRDTPIATLARLIRNVAIGAAGRVAIPAA